MTRGPYEALAENLEISHLVLKRGVKQLEIFGPKVTPAELPSFLGYALAFLANLGSHHDQEEAVVFPALSPKVPAIAQRHAEHVVLHAHMDAFKSWLENCRDGKETWDAVKFAELLKPVKDTVIPHVTAEESDVVPGSLKAAGISEEEITTLVQNMAQSGKATPDKSMSVTRKFP
ncbi:hypothetical protein HDU93_004670 [Gonapodya sp. JEL0774]|nr:hypothetical protein HDU93_004670 [Gonapodya sp. JEL0774]